MTTTRNKEQYRGRNDNEYSVAYLILGIDAALDSPEVRSSPLSDTQIR